MPERQVYSATVFRLWPANTSRTTRTISPAGAADSSPTGRGGFAGGWGASATIRVKSADWPATGLESWRRIRLVVVCARTLGPLALSVTEHRRDVVRVVLGCPAGRLGRPLVVLGQLVEQVFQSDRRVDGGGGDVSVPQDALNRCYLEPSLSMPRLTRTSAAWTCSRTVFT